jgi:hypothetical protein
MSATSNSGHPWAAVSGEPAFGHGNHEQGGAPGITKREYFAGQALAGMFANSKLTTFELDELAGGALRAADILLAALETKP